MSVPGYIVGQVKKPKHPKVAAWAKALFRASGARSQEKAAEMIGVSRSGFAKWYYGDQRPQLEEFQKLEAFAAKHGVPTFARFDPAQPVEITELSDPSGKVPADQNAGDGKVDFTDGDILKRRLEQQPAAMHARLRLAAELAMQEEEKKIAAEAQRNPSERDADNQARPRPAKSSSGRGATRT